MTFPPQGYPPPGNDPFSGDPFGGSQAPQGAPNPFQAPGQAGFPNPFSVDAPPFINAGYGPAGPGQEPPQRDNRKRLALLVVALLVVATLVIGGVLWGLNARNSKRSPATAAPTPTASPLPDAPAPLGALRPPRDIQMAPFGEQAPKDPKWISPTDALPEVLAGDAHTIVARLQDRGLIAVDAANGAPRWPQLVAPADVDPKGLHHGECAVNRAITGCALWTGNDREEVVILFDTATGVEKHHEVVSGNPDIYLYAVGDGLVAAINRDRVGYRSDGTEAWRVKDQSAWAEGLFAYRDQGIVFLDIQGREQVLDANSGRVLAEAPLVWNRTAFASGFALSDRSTLDFYDFTGTKTASVPADGYQFVGQEPNFTASSGLYYPLAFNPTTGGLRAYNAATGSVLWSEQYPPEHMSDGVFGFGSGKTCFISLGAHGTARLKTLECGTPNSDPPVELQTPYPDGFTVWLLGYDGQRLLIHEDANLVQCVDVSTGQVVWEKRENALLGGRWLGDGYFSGNDGGLYKGVLRWE